jgi:hypothetical protein
LNERGRDMEITMRHNVIGAVRNPCRACLDTNSAVVFDELKFVEVTRFPIQPKSVARSRLRTAAPWYSPASRSA